MLVRLPKGMSAEELLAAVKKGFLFPPKVLWIIPGRD